jgi:hypothetical protein
MASFRSSLSCQAGALKAQQLLSAVEKIQPKTLQPFTISIASALLVNQALLQVFFQRPHQKTLTYSDGLDEPLLLSTYTGIYALFVGIYIGRN